MTKNNIFQKLGIDYIKAYDFSKNASGSYQDRVKNVKTQLKLNEAAIKQQHSDPNMINVDANELKTFLMQRYLTNVPALVWGAPGVGKTAIVEKLSEELGIKCLIVILSRLEPTDFTGMPAIEDDATEWKLPKIFPRAEKLDNPEDGGIIFFDEINRALTPVANACLSFIQDRKLHGYELPQNWVCFAAANREDTGEANVNPMEPALLNRFDQVNFFATLDEWIKWAIADGRVQKKNAKAGILNVGDKYIHDDIIGFLMWRPDLLYMYDPDENSGILATPRSWDRAALNLEALRKIKKKSGGEPTNEEIHTAIAPAVGNGIATLFVKYLGLIKQVDVKELSKAYDDPQHCPLPPVDNPDVAHAMMLSVALAKKDEKITLKQLFNVLDYAKRFKSKELVSPLLHYVVGYHPEVKEDPNYHRDFLKVWYEFFPKAAGFQERAAKLAAEEQAKREKEKADAAKKAKNP